MSIRLLQINTVYRSGSTGRIVAGIEDVCDKFSIDHYVGYRYTENDDAHSKHEIAVSSWLDCHIHNRLTKWTGCQGCFSHLKTKAFLNKVDEIKPSILHLHNIHGSFINHSMLFRYIKEKKIPVVWTLHDCWSFTGLCPHFLSLSCYKWLNECGDCDVSRSRKYLVDVSRFMLQRKKKIFSDVKKMYLVTPSVWLRDVVSRSYLSQYPVKVINNGIDLGIFKLSKNALFKRKYGLENKFVVLGVAFDWGYKKGLDVFIELSKRLGDNYKIVLVGITENISHDLPETIIKVPKTNNREELADIYNAADLFLNPTREDTYPTVNMEAQACGIPVLTFNNGGCSETLLEGCGELIPDDINVISEKIKWIRNSMPFTKSLISEKAKQFNQQDRFAEYKDLYLDITSHEEETVK